MATKEVSTSKAFLAGAALSAAVVGGSVFVLVDDEMRPVEIVAEQPAPGSNDVLAEVSAPCWDEIRLVGANPQCSMDGTSEVRGKVVTGLWQCNNAIMGEREQACLDEGRAKAEARAKEVPKPEPVEEPVGEIVK